MAKKKKAKGAAYRSAVSGKFVKEGVAKKNPSTTVKETVSKRKELGESLTPDVLNHKCKECIYSEVECVATVVAVLAIIAGLAYMSQPW